MSQVLLNLLPEAKYVSAAERLLTPTTLAIPLLSRDDFVKNASHGHTALIALYYYLRSSALVADPLATMLKDLVPVALLQCLFSALCLPSAGRWNSGTRDGELIQGTATKTSKASLTSPKKKTGVPAVKSSRPAGVDDFSTSWPNRLFPTMFALVLSITLPPVPLMVLALVLGAPLYPTSLLSHTLALAVHVSLLAVMPLFYTHGVSAAAWKDISAAWLPFDEAGVWGATVGTLVGGWFGAIPIALDWDREWQKWPCTVLWGAVLGWFIGKNLTNVARMGIGRRIDLSVTEYPAAEENTQGSEQKKIQ